MGTHSPSQFVTLARQLRFGRIPMVGAALKNDNINVFRGKLTRDQTRREPAAANDNRSMFEFRSHILGPQLKSAIVLGSSAPGNRFPRNCNMSMVCVAGSPG